MNRSTNLQDVFLNSVRKEKINVVIMMLNGSPVSGIIKGFDNFVVMVETMGTQQLLYKHAIASIMPEKKVNISVNE